MSKRPDYARMIMSKKARDRRDLRNLKKTEVHTRIEQAIKMVWEQVQPENMELIIALKGTCGYHNKKKRVLMSLQDVVRVYYRYEKAGLFPNLTPEYLGIMILIHEIGHGMDSELEEITELLKACHKEMAAAFKEGDYESYLEFNDVRQDLVMKKENNAWDIGETLYYVPIELFDRFKKDSLRTYEQHGAALRRNGEQALAAVLQSAS